ncbi:BZ3500_MvSof-1268-A1-R1_Chr4-1g06825 [Microbotryum saponariae]|uniref:BZ3500_MvSof-1268-A1-R1_Chr4-1g06825 protein n=1 Tax=Microbotryum saponariae TaxID=289078 RepID=A0A2X0NFQ0_9BASI|nr:BZ3500_MvSof-1268-A1-R1_Chr4-1g06825 [Microbotryum saponariae]SDA06482.1 BZ3501_MvSof-1269-A2-R1_Chr4-1g06527 [Microbotryum saponariae]
MPSIRSSAELARPRSDLRLAPIATSPRTVAKTTPVPFHHLRIGAFAAPPVTRASWPDTHDQSRSLDTCAPLVNPSTSCQAAAPVRRPAPACSTHARAPPPPTPELCQSTSPVLTEPLPPPRHRQLAITALMFHRPSRASPMHDCQSQDPIREITIRG